MADTKKTDGKGTGKGAAPAAKGGGKSAAPAKGGKK